MILHIDSETPYYSLLLLKMQFFKDIACMLQTSLSQFQSDVSLVSFIYNEMVQRFNKIMQFFIKQNVIQE